MQRIEELIAQVDKHSIGSSLRYELTRAHKAALDAKQQQLDDVLRECVWAMRLIVLDNAEGSLAWAQAKNFLATPLVQDFLTRQEQKV